MYAGKAIRMSVDTLKKVKVVPEPKHPYLTLSCPGKSVALLMLTSKSWTMRKVAKLAVYEETMINVNSHQNPATIRVEAHLRQSLKVITNSCTRECILWIVFRCLYFGAMSAP